MLGCREFWAQNVIHRDIKLANVLLHFPANPELDKMEKHEKQMFLKSVDLTTTTFKAVISDFGLSTIVLPGENSQRSVCGTPLYSSP